MPSAKGLALAVGGRVLQEGIEFDLEPGEVLALAGASGSGKSTLLRCLVGLLPPHAGQVLYGTQDFYAADEEAQAALQRGLGVMFQGGALWSSMTVGENVMLPLEMHTDMPAAEREQQARFKLALVGLGSSFDVEPAALSGGMRKRAAIARALALDPPLLFLDEPSAGLDPITSARLDRLILELRDTLGTSIVLVTHELASLFAVADRVLFLDVEEKRMTALGSPRELLEHGPEAVRRFLRRSDDEAVAAPPASAAMHVPAPAGAPA